MKKFITFALCVVVTTVLIHLIFEFFNLGESFVVESILPLIVLFLLFYVFNRSGEPPKGKE